MAENKRPQRPVYNYNSDSTKSERGRPQRMTYDYAKKPKAQTGQKEYGRVRYQQPQTGHTQAQLPQQDASPFYDYAAEASAAKHSKKARQDDDYSEFFFPPRTVVTASREIPPRDKSAARPMNRKSGSNTATVSMPRRNGRENPSGNSAGPRAVTGQIPRQGSAKSRQGTKQRSKSGGAAHNRPKRPVVLADARAQRRRRNLLAALGIVAVVVVGVVLSLTVLFKIESIAVEGETSYTADEITMAFGRKEGDNLLAFRAKTAAEEMQKKLPYLENIVIHRVLPGKIRIEVTQATEAFSVSSVSGWVVLSETLRVLRIDPQPPEGMPQLVGTEALQPVLGMAVELEDSAKFAALQQLLAELHKQELLPVTEVNLTDALNISFVYAGRIRIVIGTQNDLENKIDWAKYLVTPSGEESLPDTERGTLDVSTRDDAGRLKSVWSAGTL